MVYFECFVACLVCLKYFPVCELVAFWVCFRCFMVCFGCVMVCSGVLWNVLGVLMCVCSVGLCLWYLCFLLSPLLFISELVAS